MDWTTDTTYTSQPYPTDNRDSGYAGYSRLGEWYLTACFVYLLVEGIFREFFEQLLETRVYWFTRLTPYKLWPSVLYFYTIGFIIGLFIILVGRKREGTPIRGFGIYLTLWFVYLGWGLYGKLLHIPWWHGEVRGTILPSIIVLWALVLAQHVRYEVVLSRIIKVALPFAVWALITGISFFATGADISRTSIFSITWVGEYLLLLAYVLAFSKSIAEGKGAKLSLVVLALGILAHFHKPVVATFLVTNVIMIYLAMRSGLRAGSVRIGKTILLLFILVIIAAGFGKMLWGLGEGAAERTIRERYLKEGLGTDIYGGRIEMWKKCLALWKESPIVGQGLGKRLYGVYEGMPYAQPIHNLAIQTLMQTGLVGFIIVLVATVSWLRRSIGTLAWERLPERVWTRLGLVTYICGVLFATLYGDTLAVRSIAFTFWIAVAMETTAHSQTIDWWSNGQSENVSVTETSGDMWAEKEVI